MSLTEKHQQKFWDAMGQRFGKRWFDEYGPKPTKAWLDLINGYTPDEIFKALELMHGKDLAHPPTEPQFSRFLTDAAAALAKPTQDWLRGYWRSSVVRAFEGLGALYNPPLWPLGTELRTLRGGLREQVFRAARQILDQACERERIVGQRLDSHLEQMHRDVQAALVDIASQFRAAA